jgi:hypothetical protein
LRTEIRAYHCYLPGGALPAGFLHVRSGERGVRVVARVSPEPPLWERWMEQSSFEAKQVLANRVNLLYNFTGITSVFSNISNLTKMITLRLSKRF